MRLKGAKRIKAKLNARQWIISAIQSYSQKTDKETEREIRRFVKRMQRDVISLERARVEADLTLDKAERYRKFEQVCG